MDVRAESPPPGASSIREISQIASSFATVQAAAVAAAVEQARLRRGINQVFLNISLRNQSLLHRQLGMLDGMERRTSDPAALADLFRLDHLTTRMRRHAEGLIILSGSTPGRGWRDPVPVVDVLRAAVAEVEDYVRVDVVSESPDLVAGIAVNDVIHLVAELVENATVFSPPNTRIEVRADRVGTGLVAEVEDRGLGLSPDEIDDINRRLANPSEFDLVNSEKLGLFVVSSLAARHKIKVSLRRSAYGGTTAIRPAAVRRDRPGGRGRIARRSASQAACRALRPDLGGPGPEPRSPGTHDWSPFGVTGRHRLAAAATGRRVDTGEIPASRTGNGPRPPGPHRGRPGNTSRGAAAAAAGAAAAGAGAPDATVGRRGDHTVAAAGPAGRGRANRAAADPVDPGARTASRPCRPPATEAPNSAGGTHLGMPIRVPQASLAPQLRPGSDSARRRGSREAPDVEQRAPEATRDMMMTMQQGWQRGRVDDLDDLDDAPSQGTDR